MSSKKDLLSKATTNDFGMGLYINNTTKSSTNEEPKKEEVIKEVKPIEEKKVVVKSEPKKETPKKETPRVNEILPDNEEEKELLRMISLRLPVSLLEKLNQYSYVKRLTQKDVVVMALEKIFDSKEGKDIISEYNQIIRK